MPSFYMQSQLHLLIVNVLGSVLPILYPALWTDFWNSEISQIPSTMYECKEKYCTYCTASLYFLGIHYAICWYVPTDVPTTSTIQPPFLLSPHTSCAHPGQKSTVIPQPTGSVSQQPLDATNGTYHSPKASQISSRLPVLKLAEIMSSVTPKLGDATVNARLQIIYSDHFDIYIFKSLPQHANERKDMVQSNKEKVTIENES